MTDAIAFAAHHVGLLTPVGQQIRMQSRVDESRRAMEATRDEVVSFILAWHIENHKQEQERHATDVSYVEWAVNSADSMVDLDGLYSGRGSQSTAFRNACLFAFNDPTDRFVSRWPMRYDVDYIARAMTQFYEASKEERFGGLVAYPLRDGHTIVFKRAGTKGRFAER